MIRTRMFRRVAVLIVALGVATGAGWAACPPKEEILRAVDAAGLDRGSRAGRFDVHTPRDLYVDAAKRPGKPIAHREGNTSIGVLVVDIPIEPLWKAVNDDEHHPLELAVRRNEIVGGTPRGPSRDVFGYFKQWGVGRWWVSRVEMNAALYRETGGSLWELSWTDVMDDADPSRPPISEVADDVAPILDSRGAWLLTSIGRSCTLVEYFTESDPGGTLGTTQWILATKTIRSTLVGVAHLAEGHVGEPHPGPPFVRPDGSPIP